MSVPMDSEVAKLLWMDAASDPLDPASWTKSPTPVLTSSPSRSIFGPGHNSFALDEDGETVLLVYHARTYTEIEGDPDVVAAEGEERASLLADLGVAESVVPRLARAAYLMLGRRTFFTTGDKESRAWTFRAGAKAPECAGVIHSDLQRGFIRAEVIHWDELLEIGGWSKAKDVGKLRVEGKEYEVADGDVLEIRFNV